MQDTLAFDDRGSLSRHGWIGLLAIFGLFGGLAWWASVVEIDGAIVASGSVIVETYPKRVQHQEGGTVAEFFVRNEDHVEGGQILVRLDSTAIAASLAVLKSQWSEALVREARLIAEIGGAPSFTLPQALATATPDPQIAALFALERQVSSARLTAKAGQAAQLREQIAQLETQISGLETQQRAVGEQLDILLQEIADLTALQGQGLIESSRVTTLVKQRAQLEGAQGQLVANLAGTKAEIAERRLQISQLDADYLSAALDQLQSARRTIADTGEQIRATQDRLDRTDIRAPQAGVIHESVIHTVGGVVGAGEVLMQVVPQDDELRVSLRVSPMDIDRVTLGQSTSLRFSGLDTRDNPELNAIITTIAPDVTQDQPTGAAYYLATVEIPEAELLRLPDPALVMPGVPAEAFIKTDHRTVLSYLIQPFADQVRRALREH